LRFAVIEPQTLRAPTPRHAAALGQHS
jgi:hypothetical protein